MDIADRLGVSVATVSYALNGRPGVGAELRERILATAVEIGYRPNRLARGLRTGETRSVGMLVEDIANPFSADLASALLRAASERGLQVFVSHPRHPGALGQKDFDALRDSGVEGVILASVVNFDDRPLMEQIAQHGPPVVQVIRHLEGIRADAVAIDDRSAARAAADHVLGLGATDVAIIAGPQRSPASRMRLEGFRDAFAAAGLIPLPERVLVAGYTIAEGREAARRLVSSTPPHAILCGNDLLAIGAIDALLEQGLRVPEDVAVVGFDDIALAAIRQIRLTTVRQPREAIGEIALSTLLRRIEGDAGPPARHLVPHELVVRDSCGARLGSALGRAR